MHFSSNTIFLFHPPKIFLDSYFLLINLVSLQKLTTHASVAASP